MMKRFAVFSAGYDSSLQFQSDDPEAVAAFMWGRDLNNYRIFVRADNLPASLGQMQELLSGMSVPPLCDCDVCQCYGEGACKMEDTDFNPQEI